MGIKPKPWDYCAIDHYCWPPGLTPNLIKVFISGIRRSRSKWLPGDGSPANGYFDCYRDGPTAQTWTSSGWPKAKLSLTFAISKLQAWSSTGVSCFYKEDLYVSCRYGFSSVTNCSFAKFCEGHAYRMPSLFLWDIAAKVMNSEWQDPNYECFPLAVPEIVVRVARIRDATNIHIKFDTSV